MRQYPIPYQTGGEDPVIGGLLTLRQLIYVVLGVAVGGGLAAALPAPWWARLAVIIPFALAGAGFAFIQVKGDRLDVYLWRLWRFKRKKKVWVWKGEMMSAEIEGEVERG